MLNKTEISKNITIVPIELTDNQSVSLKAKGLYAFIAAQGDEQALTINSMAQRLKEGRHAIKNCVDELEAAGWIDRAYSTHGVVIREGAR